MVVELFRDFIPVSYKAHSFLKTNSLHTLI